MPQHQRMFLICYFSSDKSGRELILTCFARNKGTVKALTGERGLKKGYEVEKPD